MVWEGDEYGGYHGELHGQTLLLYEGGGPPAPGAAVSEALLLHGCTPEVVDRAAFARCIDAASRGVLS